MPNRVLPTVSAGREVWILFSNERVDFFQGYLFLDSSPTFDGHGNQADETVWRSGVGGRLGVVVCRGKGCLSLLGIS